MMANKPYAMPQAFKQALERCLVRDRVAGGMSLLPPQPRTARPCA